MTVNNSYRKVPVVVQMNCSKCGEVLGFMTCKYYGKPILHCKRCFMSSMNK